MTKKRSQYSPFVGDSHFESFVLSSPGEFPCREVDLWPVPIQIGRHIPVSLSFEDGGYSEDPIRYRIDHTF